MFVLKLLDDNMTILRRSFADATINVNGNPSLRYPKGQQFSE